MTPLRFPLMLTVICFLPLTATRVDAAPITWLGGFDPEFTITRGNASWIWHEGIPPGLLRRHGTRDSENGKRRGRGHNRDEQAVSNETPPLTDAVDFYDIPGLVDDVKLLEGGLEPLDPGEDLGNLHLGGDDPSSTASSRDDATALASVPEPSSMLLLISAGVAWVTRSRHRRRQSD